MNKKVMLIAVLAIIIGGVVLSRLWLRLPSGPQIHPLAMTVTEQHMPTPAMDSIPLGHFVPGTLHVDDDIATAARGQAVIQAPSEWEVVGVKMRTSPQGAWQPVKPPPITKATDWPVKFGHATDLSYWEILGFANRAGEWQFTLRLTRLYRAEQSGDTWEGSVEHVVTAHLSEDPDKPKYPPLMPGKAYVAEIECKLNGWQKIPQEGEPGFPLTLSNQSYIDFRATKKNPREPWPSSGQAEEWPCWEGDGIESGSCSVDNITLDIDGSNLVARHAHDYKTISAICGNKVQRKIRIMARPEIFTAVSPTPFVGASQKKNSMRKFDITAEIRWGDGWHLPTKFHFSAREIVPANSKRKSIDRPIGQINGSTTQDDTVSLPDDGGIAKATLTVPANAGTVEVKAMLVIPGNTSEFRTQRVGVSNLQ